MQRFHRDCHRLIWLILGPLVIAAFIYALTNRPEMPVMDAVPGEGPRSPETQGRN